MQRTQGLPSTIDGGLIAPTLQGACWRSPGNIVRAPLASCAEPSACPELVPKPAALHVAMQPGLFPQSVEGLRQFSAERHLRREDPQSMLLDVQQGALHDGKCGLHAEQNDWLQANEAHKHLCRKQRDPHTDEQQVS